MKYKEIYFERKLEPTTDLTKLYQFFNLTLYEAADNWPMMIKVETGWHGDEDYYQSWELMPPYTSRPAAIREVIKRLDNHQFEPPV